MPAQSGPRRSDARVLVIEDADASRAVESGLAAAGHRVQAYRDGHDVEHVLAQFRPDVVVLDVMLPGRDGFAVLEVIRSRCCGGWAGSPRR